MATLRKECVSIFTDSVTSTFSPSFYPKRQNKFRTPWFSQGKFEEAGVYLRLILEKNDTCKSTVLQVCTTKQRKQLEKRKYKSRVLRKLDLSPAVVLVPEIELYRVTYRWACCVNISESLAIKPTLLKLPLVVELESKPPNKNTAFHHCKTHGHGFSYGSSVTFQVHFRPAAVPPAALSKLHGGLLSDVSLRVGTEELRAHRNVLAAASEVFMSMFQSDRFQEGSHGVVDVKDVRVEVMKAALRHVYGQGLGEVDANTVVELLILAERYQLLELKALCEDLLSRDTSLDALQLLAVADTHHAQFLKEAVIKRITSAPKRKDILSKESAREILRSNPEAIVELLVGF